MKQWKVPARQKLVAFLQEKLGNLSGKFLRKLLEANLCKVNGKIERFGSVTVEAGDVVTLAPWEHLTKQEIRFDTIYEDEFLQIVDKPAGFVCADNDARKAFGSGRFLVHRLDKTTTGLLILAKSVKVRDELMALFEERKIEKQYLALVDGCPKQKSGEIRNFLGKIGSFQGQSIWGAVPKGLTAVTGWKVLAVGENSALILCEPQTGRTHQIRVHMAGMGHPIIIDRQYAKFFRSKVTASRPLLHAYRLQFSYKDKKIDVIAKAPQDMREALLAARFDVAHLGEFLSN